MNMSRYILAILAIVWMTGCPSPDPELQQAREDLEKLQASNAKLLADKRTCAAQLDELQEAHLKTCASVEELNIQRATQTIQIVEDSATPCAGVDVEITKLDGDRGWVYLKYAVEGNVRFSDRLWFQGKPDRDVLLLSDLPTPVLLRVAGCENGTCQLDCKKLIPDEYVCKTP